MWVQRNSDEVRKKFDSSRKHCRRAKNANDCLACKQLQRKCDRKKPYCTQCIEHSKDCSGYKNALKWNIEVASRSKLRGLALLIITSKKMSRSFIASGRKKIISNQLQNQTSENFKFIHAFSSQSFSAWTELEKKQYIFVNMISHYSKIKMPST